jgi:hypothetical protein
MRFVAVKSLTQQDLLLLHRVRSRLLKNRSALCNHLRGLLCERGVAVRVGVTALKHALPRIFTQENCDESSTASSSPMSACSCLKWFFFVGIRSSGLNMLDSSLSSWR